MPVGNGLREERKTMSISLPQSARDLIAGGALAHLVTLNPDGGPQVSGVWVKVDGDELVVATLRETQKVKNLRRDPRTVLSFESPQKNAMGLTEYLVVYGTATIHEGGAAAVLQELARGYIGPGAKFPPTDNPPPGYLIRVRVERVGGVGPRGDRLRGAQWTAASR
jgi:PPOX class probable F420-dependent enzyme